MDKGKDMNDSGQLNQVTAMLRSHLEAALTEIWSSSGLVTDSDEDYPFRSRTSACWVSVIGETNRLSGSLRTLHIPSESQFDC